MLSRAIARDRLHHALVLVGPRGVGKATLALGLCCALNCSVAPAVGCGTCSTCRRILGGTHTDVSRLRGEGKMDTILTEPARELVIRLQHAPFEGRAHVAIIDPADRIHPSAANAMLKALEEPNDGVYFVLIANNLADILPTIVSRSLTLRLAGLGAAATRTVVEERMSIPSSGPDAPADLESRLELAVRLSDGRPGIALSLLDDPSLEVSERLLRASLEAMAAGPSGIFAGDASKLWTTWNEAVLAVPDPEAARGEADEEPAVVVVKGTKKKSKASTPRKKKTSAAPKRSPARERAAAHRLAELWLLHLHRRVHRPGSGDDATELHRLGRQLDHIQRFQTSLARNPNVRLALEQTLLAVSAGSPA